MPAAILNAIGGLGYLKHPIICGGGQNYAWSNKCYSLENNEWVSADSMNTIRVYAAAAQLQDGRLLVTGGNNLNSAEMLTKAGWESNIPSLPVTLEFHCVVTVNSSTVFVIGGFKDTYYYSSRSFYFNLGEGSWIEGPKLKYERSRLSCGKIRRDKDSQDRSIIVAGGTDGNFLLSSVEILDERSNEWRTGPELPFGINLSQMVEDQNGGVVLIGGDSTIGRLDTLYQLPHGGQEAVWTKMEQKLKKGRVQHTAFLVPDNIVDCS
jgi:hypothetical protein